MKKLIKIVALSLVLCACFMLSACSFTARGTYKVSEVRAGVGNALVRYQVGDTILGIGEITEDFSILELKGNEVCEYTLNGNKKIGTWEYDNGKIEVEINEQDIVFVKDGKTLTYTIDIGAFNLEIVLTK